jgi:hypothetical protein
VEELIEKDAKGPVIDGEVVFLFEDHFGGHVLVGSAEGFAFHLDVVSGPAEVADFDVAGVVEEDVFGLIEGRSTLMSRCMMSWECRYFMALRVWLKNLKASA